MLKRRAWKSALGRPRVLAVGSAPAGSSPSPARPFSIELVISIGLYPLASAPAVLPGDFEGDRRITGDGILRSAAGDLVLEDPRETELVADLLRSRCRLRPRLGSLTFCVRSRLLRRLGEPRRLCELDRLPLPFFARLPLRRWRAWLRGLDSLLDPPDSEASCEPRSFFCCSSSS